MADYTTENLELIVRYDGSKLSFESSAEKASYISAGISKVVFITGSTAQNASASDKAQHIWVSNGTSHKYLDMTNINDIKDGLTHIAGFAIDGVVKSGAGANGINFKGLNGVTVTLKPETSTDNNGVKYWTIEVNGETLQNSINSVNATATSALNKANANGNAIINLGTEISNIQSSLENYATDEELEAAKSEIIGQNSDQISANIMSLYSVKNYALAAANTAKNEAIDHVEPLLAGKADLENGKIKEGQLPDYIFGQMLFGGTITAGGADSMEVSPSSKLLDKVNKPSTTSLTINKADASTYEGAYFIVTGGLTSIFGFSVVVGDWIVSTGNDWRKVDNTDAVSSVAGLTGVITASVLAEKLAASDNANELALKSEVDAKYSLPNGGIPEKDLAGDVVEKINKGKTSVQSVSGGDFISVTDTSGTTNNKSYEVSAKTKTMEDAKADILLNGEDALATAHDVYNFIKARLSVKVVS